ncbi:MAG: hypothetical protein KDD58_02470 [Bdellovibrionales bacterium]|nr:hypothetical protein [Bdellovibrionales bacterium]
MRLILFVLISTLSSYSFAKSKTNPDISLNTLFTYQQSNLGNHPDAESTNGFALQEAELRLTSNIDTYFRGDVILALEKEAPEAPGEESEFVVEPEEVFIETLSIPGVTIRLGKFYPFWGRTNQRHTHNFAFIDAPFTRSFIFGDEGFNENGLAISYLVPLPWYSEVVLQAFSAQNEQIFGSRSQDDVAGVLFLKNLWDVSDASTFELDLSYGTGEDVLSERNHIYNSALTYKYKNNFRSFILTAEYTMAEKLYDDSPNNVGRSSALSNWFKLQFNKYWWLQARYEVASNLEDKNIKDVTKSTGLIAYVPSEYSAIRLQYDKIDDPSLNDTEQRATLQLNLTMGTHPAHDY